jgi:hypothetical protein
VVWIRIRIHFGLLDPDPEGQKLKEKKNLEISFFEVLDNLF